MHALLIFLLVLRAFTTWFPQGSEDLKMKDLNELIRRNPKLLSQLMSASSIASERDPDASPLLPPSMSSLTSLVPQLESAFSHGSQMDSDEFMPRELSDPGQATDEKNDKFPTRTPKGKKM